MAASGNTNMGSRFTTRRVVDWDEYGVEEWVRQQTWKCLKYLGKSLFLLLQININKHMKHTRGMATECTHNSLCSVIHQQPTATGTDDGVVINIWWIQQSCDNPLSIFNASPGGVSLNFGNRKKKEATTVIHLACWTSWCCTTVQSLKVKAWQASHT